MEPGIGTAVGTAVIGAAGGELPTSLALIPETL
jgi:hypothetical protein